MLATYMFESKVSGIDSETMIFHKHTPPEVIDLVCKLLQYSPNLRCTVVSNEMNNMDLSFSFVPVFHMIPFSIFFD